MISQYIDRIRNDKRVLDNKNKVLMANWDDDNAKAFEDVILKKMTQLHKTFLDNLSDTTHLKGMKNEMNSLINEIESDLGELESL